MISVEHQLNPKLTSRIVHRFDCVYPTRTARFGNAMTATGVLNLRHASYAYDFQSIEKDCKCTTCRPRSEGGLEITRAYIHHLAAKETAGAHLLSVHNVFYLLDLLRRARQAILNDEYPRFLRNHFHKMFKGQKDLYPEWAVDALKGVNVDITMDT